MDERRNPLSDMTFSRRQLLPIVGAVTLLAGGATAVDAQEPIQTQLFGARPPVTVSAAYPVSRLVQSTGNLYWTVNTAYEFSPNSQTVYRTSKSAKPGDERAVYRTWASPPHLGALTFARVSGVWRFFVLADDYSWPGGLRVLQLPQTPSGAPRTLATIPREHGGDLKTDGTSLFWSDSGGIRSMPITGGTVRTLVRLGSNTALGLDTRYVYYASGSSIRRVPKTGGVSSSVVVASTTIASFFVRAGAITTVYWGEGSGAVRGRAVGSTFTATYQRPTSGRKITSVSFDESRILWSDCSTNGLQCSVRIRSGNVTTSVATDYFAHDVQGDAHHAYWADGSGIKRYTY